MDVVPSLRMPPPPPPELENPALPPVPLAVALLPAPALPPRPAELPLIVELVMVNLAPLSLKIPPPYPP